MRMPLTFDINLTMSKMADEERDTSVVSEEMEIDDDSDDEDVASDDESEEEELYEVDKIVGMRNGPNVSGKSCFEIRSLHSEFQHM